MIRSVVATERAPRKIVSATATSQHVADIGRGPGPGEDHLVAAVYVTAYKSFDLLSIGLIPVELTRHMSGCCMISE